MGALASLIGPAISAFFGALFAAFRGKREDRDRIDAHERASVAEAATETEQAIVEIADERSALPGAVDDPGELARRLRGRKST